MDRVFCDTCGKECVSNGFSTGYGYDDKGNKHCYECCANQDKEFMREYGKISLYLVKRDNKYYVTNWPNTLSFPVSYAKKGKHNIAGQRVDVWFNFDNKCWHGVNYGNFSEICHCKVTKQ